MYGRYGDDTSGVATIPPSPPPSLIPPPPPLASLPLEVLRERQVEVGAGGLPAGAQRTGSYTELVQQQTPVIASAAAAAAAAASVTVGGGGCGGVAASLRDCRTPQPSTAAVAAVAPHPAAADVNPPAPPRVSPLPPLLQATPMPASGASEVITGPVAVLGIDVLGATPGASRDREVWKVTVTTLSAAAAAHKREVEATVRAEAAEARAAEAEAKAEAAHWEMRRLAELHSHEVAAAKEQERQREHQV